MRTFSEDLNEMGMKIAKKRRMMGYSQDECSEKAGLSRTALGNIERGTASPKAEAIFAICRVLEAEPNEVMPGDLIRKPSNTKLDPRMLEMAEMSEYLPVDKKNSFYETMGIVLAGLMAG